MGLPWAIRWLRVFPWVSYGTSRLYSACPWDSRGGSDEFVVLPWISHGIIVLAHETSIGLPWVSHGSSMGSIFSYGSSMGFPLYFHGIMVLAHGTPMGLPLSCSAPMGLSCDAHENPNTGPWVSHGFDILP